MPRGVANENRSKSVKCIIIPKKMEQDFPTIGFISRKWINIILRGHFTQTRCPCARAYGCKKLQWGRATHVS